MDFDVRAREKDAALIRDYTEGYRTSHTKTMLPGRMFAERSKQPLKIIYAELLILGRKQKLRWFSHISRSFGLEKMIVQGK